MLLEPMLMNKGKASQEFIMKPGHHRNRKQAPGSEMLLIIVTACMKPTGII